MKFVDLFASEFRQEQEEKATLTSAASPDPDSTAARGVSWDLSDLYSSPGDPAVKKDQQRAIRMARDFSRNYRGKIRDHKSLTPKLMAEALERYEKLLDLTYKPHAYARLVHSADTSLPEAGALLSGTQETVTRVQTEVMFFELDWIALADQRAQKIIQSPECARWRHFLKSTRRYRPHTLSEAEEIILTEKNNTGVQAMRRLFDEVTSKAKFKVDVEGRLQTLTQSEALALLYHPNRQVRKAAHAGFTAGLEENTHLPTFILNTVIQDHAIDCRLKKYADPAAPRHLANEIEARSVDALIQACESHYYLFQDYYRLKAKLLGLSTLYDYDRYAPVEPPGTRLPTCDWDSARQLVLGSFLDFSPELEKIVEEFLDNNWIDAEPRTGKRGGAFCSSSVPSVHPFILMNFTGKLSDVMTLAHELGHGVHQRLAQPLGILQCMTPLTLAETASVFGEMLVFNRLTKEQTDPKVKLSLLCHKLEDSFATVFRQVVLTRFEEKLHTERAKGELSTSQVDQFWMETNTEMHGSAVELTDGYKRWWSYIGHFIQSPFYCYAYSFGELLVLALWKQYQDEGESFVPRYLELLAAGGSDTPAELVDRVGLDINDPGFWASGLSILHDLLAEAQELAQKI